MERDRVLATRTKQTTAKSRSAAVGIITARTVADQSVRAVLSRIFAFIFETDIWLEIEQAGIVLALYGIPRCPFQLTQLELVGSADAVFSKRLSGQTNVGRVHDEYLLCRVLTGQNLFNVNKSDKRLLVR